MFLNAFAGLARYDEWAAGWQSAAHWLVQRKGGPGSLFCAYDKPLGRHLVHYAEVIEFEPGRLFRWRAPFAEWPRICIGSILEVAPSADGGCDATETMYFEAAAEHLPVLAGFQELTGLRSQDLEQFLTARLNGLGDLLARGRICDVAEPFAEDKIVAGDWDARRAKGNWVRILYADGEIEFDGPPDLVFDAFSRFAHYADWTRSIHVGMEWLKVTRGGVGSQFVLWEKPGDRHVLHFGVVTECERNRKFTWRAPFAEWGKVLLGTSMTIIGSTTDKTKAYHVLYLDVPEEYLPIAMGFGSLRGFDLEFETFHIYEEAKGFNELLKNGGFTGEEAEYLFETNRDIARDIPLQHGECWPIEAATVVPDRVVTFEELLTELAGSLSKMIPAPEFLQAHRNAERMWRRNSRTPTI